MKKAKQITIQYTVLSLLAMYLVIALVHIAYMPKLNDVVAKFNASSPHIDFFHKNNNAGNTGTMYQRGIRSVIENKRKTLVPVMPAFALFFAFIFGSLLSLGLTQKPGSHISPLSLLQSKPYLKLRSLRI